MLPVVVTYNIIASGGTASLAASQASTAGLLALATTVVGANQQRITVTSAGNDAGIYFHVIGFNQANFTIFEYLAGGLGTGVAGSAGTVQSNLDYNTIVSIQPSASSVAQTLATTAGTVSAGTNNVGSTLPNIMNWHATPTDISVSAIVQSGAANYTVQYTYDDPNNLPSGLAAPTWLNVASLTGQTVNGDAELTNNLTALRLLVNSGTGTMRFTVIQGGIGTP